MGFGFGDTDEDDENRTPDHLIKDIIRYQNWDDIKAGLRVRSLITNSEGVITKAEKLLQTITIEWDNGNVSNFSRLRGNKVVIVRNENEEKE